jgi:hypothetical protein
MRAIVPLPALRLRSIGSSVGAKLLPASGTLIIPQASRFDKLMNVAK